MKTKINVLQFALGLIAFFTFFAAMFNGLEKLMILSASLAFATNAVVSALVTKKKTTREGLHAAIAFAGPALVFTLFSLGDAIFLGKFKPFLFWLLGALVTLSAGLLGVWRSHSSKTQSK